MRQELIQQTQEMAATATNALDSILALRLQLFADIDAAQEDPAQSMYSCHHLAQQEKQLREIDMAIGQVRIYLLGFHRTLANAQALIVGNIEIPHQIIKHGNPWPVAALKT